MILHCSSLASVQSAQYSVISGSTCEFHAQADKDQVLPDVFPNDHHPFILKFTYICFLNNSNVYCEPPSVHVYVYTTEGHVCCKQGFLYIRTVHVYVCEMIVHEPSVIVYALCCVFSVCNEQSLYTRVLQLLCADSVCVSCLSCLVGWVHG